MAGLIITRKWGEPLVIDGRITIYVEKMVYKGQAKYNQVKIRIIAPRDVTVERPSGVEDEVDDE